MAEEIQNQVRKIIEKIAPTITDTIELDSDLFAIGALDSFGVIEFVTELENVFNIKVPNEDLIPQNLWSIEATSDLVSKYI